MDLMFLIGYCLAGLVALVTESFTGFLSEFVKSWIILPVWERSGGPGYLETVAAWIARVWGQMMLEFGKRFYLQMDLIPALEHRAMVEAWAQERAQSIEQIDQERAQLKEQMDQERAQLKEQMAQLIEQMDQGISSNSEEATMSTGPLGVPGGDTWAYKGEGKITQIIIIYGIVVDSLIFLSESTDGMYKCSQKFGGNGGHKTDKVCIDEPLTRIHLTIASLGSEKVISSISFRTNGREYGPFGTVCRTSLSIPIMEGGVIFGFHGRSTQYLKAIGLIIKPPTSPTLEYEGMSSNSEECLSLGPLGLPGGEPWAYMPKDKITQIIISYGNVVDSLIFLSESTDGLNKCAKKFGGNGGHKIAKVCIDDPLEHLTSIHLTTVNYGSAEGWEDVISSISFLTNVRKYGPFGTYCGTSLSIPIVEGSVIVGFYGLSTRFLKAIGIFVMPPKAITGLPGLEH